MRDIPKAIILTSLLVTLVYVMISVSLFGMTKLQLLEPETAVALWEHPNRCARAGRTEVDYEL